MKLVIDEGLFLLDFPFHCDQEAAEMLNGMTTAEGREADLDKALAAVGAYDAKKR